MKFIKKLFAFIILWLAGFFHKLKFSADLGSRFKNKYPDDKTHYRIKGKRMLITDYIRQQSNKLPEMFYPDGSKANHFLNMKKRFRAGGLKDMIKYIEEVNKQVKKIQS